jgi:hypothetical protein
LEAIVLVGLAVAVVVDAVTELFGGAGGLTEVLAAVERVAVAIVIPWITSDNGAAPVDAGHLGERSAADVGAGKGLAGRGAAAAVVGVTARIVVLADLAVAVVVGAVTAIGAIAVLRCHRLDDAAEGLTAVLDLAIEIGRSREALFDHALALDAGRQGVGDRADDVASTTVEGVGVEEEAFIDEPITVVVTTVTDLDAPRHTAIGCSIAWRRGVLTLEAVGIEGAAREGEQRYDYDDPKVCARS